MAFMQVKDFKKSRELWKKLEREREMVVTCDGQPRAILLGIRPDELEWVQAELRRTLFSVAVGRVRRRAERLPDAQDDIAAAIAESRGGRA
jgi:hypothetical protein